MKTHRTALLCLALMAAVAPLSGQTATPNTEFGDLTLQQPATQNDYIIDGANWVCSGTSCHADYVSDMPALRSCQRVVAKVGAVASFTYRGKALNETELATCNTKAKA